MAPVTHQTIKLGKGKHSSPVQGACVMELASMLAGEPFSDHPLSVCPVIGSFLRAYNDSIDDDRRQDLYAYASRVVGSRGSEELARARAERLKAWVAELEPRRPAHFPFIERLRELVPKPPLALSTRAVQAISKHNDRSHAAVLALIDELLAIGAGEHGPTPAMLPAGDTLTTAEAPLTR